MKYIILLFIASANMLNAQTIKVNDTDFSKGRIGNLQEITIDDLSKFHGHKCDGLVEGFLALREALLYLYPDGVADRTNTRIVSKSSPCLSDAAIYLTGGRYQYNSFYVDDRVKGFYFVQRMDTGKGIYVERIAGVKPPMIDSLNNLAIKGKLDACELASLKLYEDNYALNLLDKNAMNLFTLYEEVPKTKWKWKPKAKNDYIKTDVINKNVGVCDIKTSNKLVFLSLKPVEFEKEINNRNYMVLDVRTPEELIETGRIKYSQNINFLADDFEQRINQLDKEKTYFLYCRSGKRSFNAMEVMKKNGFKKLVMLDGGISRWQDEQLTLFRF
ncbi:MAG: hypothetical protein IPM42_01070 [Saprospiraceae bacterium]|nr:hypothetical protein [Saprospiraceae bacterium]